MNLMDVTVSRMISAPPDKIFDVWLDANSPGGPWFGSERTILNPVVDGLFYLLIMYEGRSWAHYGLFLQIERPRLVKYTWVSEATKGLESVVSVTIEPRGKETEVTLHHTGIPDDELGHKHKDGWNSMLTTLAARFAGTTQPV
jgi:uncharacterized protein YndB with AHSA1/START domain